MHQASAQQTLRLIHGQSRFGRYKPESESGVHGTTHERNKCLERMLDTFASFLRSQDRGGAAYMDYEKAKKAAARLSYSPKDVLDFSVAWAALEAEARFSQFAGYFISALIHCGPDPAYTIQTRNISEPISNLGFWNRKTLTIIGDAGVSLGHLARKGSTLVLEGGCGDIAGCNMTGGTIIIHGGTGERAGCSMKNGQIIIKGTAGRLAGYDMQGGSIILEGEYESLSRCIMGGRIYHKGKLIVE